jgi:hypothetical protein
MQDRIELLQRLIDENHIAQDIVRKQITTFELDPEDYQESFNEMLDEEGPADRTYYPSQILLDCDPIAYREGLLNYVDSLDKSEVSDDYKALVAEFEALVSEAETLADMLSELNEGQEILYK